jgi:hypothetical protein
MLRVLHFDIHFSFIIRTLRMRMMILKIVTLDKTIYSNIFRF